MSVAECLLRTNTNICAADQVLSEKLSHERSLELENSDTSKLPEGIQEFQESSGWKIEDGSGTHDVVFTKEFGNEVYERSSLPAAGG
jgi:Mitochondrial glycoprotein